MARTLPILDAAQRREFDHPPKLSQTQRKLFFDLPEWGVTLLRTLVASHSRSGFVLQVGYFKATGRFFSVERFLGEHQKVWGSRFNQALDYSRRNIY